MVSHLSCPCHTHTHSLPALPFPVPLSPSPTGTSKFNPHFFSELSELSLLLVMLVLRLVHSGLPSPHALVWGLQFTPGFWHCPQGLVLILYWQPPNFQILMRIWRVAWFLLRAPPSGRAVKRTLGVGGSYPDLEGVWPWYLLFVCFLFRTLLFPLALPPPPRKEPVALAAPGEHVQLPGLPGASPQGRCRTGLGP